ncbi:hypothetical protein WCP94_003426 [Bilophila wadsworthia]
MFLTYYKGVRNFCVRSFDIEYRSKNFKMFLDKSRQAA